MNLSHHSVGSVTGSDYIMGIRQEFCGNMHGIARADELGTLDAPTDIQCGGMYRNKKGETYSIKSQRWNAWT